MEETTNSNQGSANQAQKETVGRRKLLKALAATGGAVTAASLLPHKWVKPVVEAGVLPAHAQGSDLIITNLVVQQVNNLNGTNSLIRPSDVTIDGEVGEFFFYCASFDYHDALGKVDGNTLLFFVQIYSPSGALQSLQGPLSTTILTGDGFDGTISGLCFFVLYGPLAFLCEEVPDEDVDIIECKGDSSNDTSVQVTFSIQTTDGRRSNSLSKTLPRPNG